MTTAAGAEDAAPGPSSAAPRVDVARRSTGCGAARDVGTPAGGQRSAVTGAGSMSSKDWFSPAMAHTNE